MVIIVGTTAIIGFSVYLRRKTKALESKNQRQFAGNEPPPRSLFEPDEAEIRASERAEAEINAAKTADEARLLSEEKIEDAREFQKLWAENPNRSNTVELFRRAAESGNAGIFSESAERIMDFWRKGKIENLTATDLADLLDSHLLTLPQQERFSGAIFWIKREIENLRGKSE